jgi:hypothetical protein
MPGEMPEWQSRHWAVAALISAPWERVGKNRTKNRQKLKMTLPMIASSRGLPDFPSLSL